MNSIDAGATCVGVRMDMGAFKVQVIDNGRGMTAEDISCVGNRYYTSKCNSLEDLDDLRFYGFRGEALASIVSLATLLEISSRTKASAKTHVKIFKEGKGLDVFEAEVTRPSAGTTVTVCNYFHNMPVRRNRLDAVLENERIRQRVEAISLMHPFVSFTLKNDCTGAMLIQLPKARNTYYRFVQIHSLARAQKLGEVNYTSGQFEVIGYIGKEGHYNKNLQFLYVNERLLLKTRIHKLLTGLLRRIINSNQKKESPEAHSATRSQKPKRNQDLYAIFVINIKCSFSEYDICLEPAKTLIEFKDWDCILHCIDMAVKDFLRREDLEAEFSQDEMQSEFPQSEIANSSQTNTQSDKCVSTSNFPKIDSALETALSSKSVYRSHADESSNRQDRKDNEEQQNVKKCLSKSTSNSTSGTIEVEHSNMSSDFCRMEKTKSNSQIASQLLEINPQERPKESTCSESEKGAESELCQASKQVKSNNIVPPASGPQTFVDTRKVTLSDPYVHKSFQIGQHVNLSHAPKRKVSLGTLQKTSLEEVCKEPVPVKIRKIISLSSVSQSLEIFRRNYGKSKHILPDDSSRCCGNSEDMNYGESLPTFNGTNTKEDGHQRPGPSTLTAFTKIKPVSQNMEKKSVATKLCNSRQQTGTEPNLTQLLTAATTSQADNGITRDFIQENENFCNTEHNPDPDSAHSLEMKPFSDEWLPHFDPSWGKTVYVNKVTGLSSYEAPSAKQGETQCTSDVTNMAVSVMSDAGEDDENSNSLYSMYSKWNNPVYVRPPKVCVDISRGQENGPSVKVHNVLFPYRFTKAMIPTMKVINQVDKKFLACLINTRENTADNASETDGNLLVLVDQHAAHERVRLENLIEDAYEDDSDVKRLSSSIIMPPLEIHIPKEEQRLLRSCGKHLQNLGLDVTFSEEEESRVFIGKVPLCFTEKDINERRRGRPSVLKSLAEDYLQEQIELLRSAGRLRATLPLTVQKVLASFACHGAVKFNTILTKDECFSLVASLSACQLPFQCAHGRPSIAPLVDLHHIDTEEKETQRPNLSKLRRMIKAWQLFGNR